LQSFEDESLNQLIGEAWGEVRAPSGDNQQHIDELKSKLSAAALAKGDKGNGRALFIKHCQGCHRLYGQGEQVGPDLTGGNRDNLDYLLSNLIDPSAVVDKDFRMTRILTADGRLLTGLVTAESERTITLRTSTESVVLEKNSIESRSITDQSPMPSGMLDLLTDDQIRDLITYLRHPTQVPLAQ
jgi:putative heme-binding domain-containing protein